MVEPGRDGAPQRAKAQLDAIGEVHEFLRRDEIDHWLFGGWAVDFHAGAITRPHDDVDLAVWADDHDRIATILRSSGWTHVPADDDDGGTGYVRDPVRLELTFLVRGDDGTVQIRLRDADVTWAGGRFDFELLELDGQRCRVLDRASLTRTKSTLRDGADEQAKDADDLGVLGGLTGPA